VRDAEGGAIVAVIQAAGSGEEGLEDHGIRGLHLFSRRDSEAR